MKKTSGIYRITCLATDKIYIGSSTSVQRRFYQHRTELKHNTHVNPHLQNAFNKYGMRNFIFEILEECSVEELQDLEKKYLDELQPFGNKGFNIDRDPVRIEMAEETKEKIRQAKLGTTYSEESKQKMSDSAKARFESQEERDKLSRAHRGKTHSEETRKKMSESRKAYLAENDHPMLGATHTEEHKQKISETLKGRSRDPENTKKIIETKKANGTFNLSRTKSDEEKAKISATMKEKYKGKANNSAKLTVEEVKEIKRLLQEGISRKEICERISTATYVMVGKIARRERWNHIKL